MGVSDACQGCGHVFGVHVLGRDGFACALCSDCPRFVPGGITETPKKACAICGHDYLAHNRTLVAGQLFQGGPCARASCSCSCYVEPTSLDMPADREPLITGIGPGCPSCAGRNVNVACPDCAEDLCAGCRDRIDAEAAAAIREEGDRSVLEEAQALVHGARNADYGHPAVNDARIAALWRALFGWDVKTEDVWQAMVLTKLSRERSRPKRDNRVDVAGYAEVGDWIHRAKQGGQGA